MRAILEGKKVVKCEDLLKWGKWYAKADRTVAKTKKNNVGVSTVFLAFTNSLNESHLLFFETMVFGGEHDGEQWRYATWEEAEAGHAKVCKEIFS